MQRCIIKPLHQLQTSITDDRQSSPSLNWFKLISSGKQVVVREGKMDVKQAPLLFTLTLLLPFFFFPPPLSPPNLQFLLILIHISTAICHQPTSYLMLYHPYKQQRATSFAYSFQIMYTLFFTYCYMTSFSHWFSSTAGQQEVLCTECETVCPSGPWIQQGAVNVKSRWLLELHNQGVWSCLLRDVCQLVCLPVYLI